MTAEPEPEVYRRQPKEYCARIFEYTTPHYHISAFKAYGYSKQDAIDAFKSLFRDIDNAMRDLHSALTIHNKYNAEFDIVIDIDDLSVAVFHPDLEKPQFYHYPLYEFLQMHKQSPHYADYFAKRLLSFAFGYKSLMHNYYETLRPIIRDYIRSADHPALPTNYDYHITDNATIRILYQPSYFEIEIRAELRYLSFDYKRKVEYDDYVGINIERFLIPAYQIDRNPAIITKFFDTCIRAFDIASYLTDFIRLYFFDEDIHTFIDFEANTESPRIKILVKKYIGTDPDFARKIYKRLAYLELSRPEFYTLSNDTILHYIISLLKQNSTS